MKKVFLLAIALFTTNLFAQASVQEVTNRIWNLKSMSDSLAATTVLDTLVFTGPSYNLSMTARADTIIYKFSYNKTKWPHWQYLIPGQTQEFVGMKIDSLFFKANGTGHLMLQWGQQR